LRGFESLILCQKMQIPIWVSAFFIVGIGIRTHLNAARMSAARDGLTERNLD
jgi:hypothetical protein